MVVGGVGCGVDLGDDSWATGLGRTDDDGAGDGAEDLSQGGAEREVSFLVARYEGLKRDLEDLFTWLDRQLKGVEKAWPCRRY